MTYFIQASAFPETVKALIMSHKIEDDSWMQFLTLKPWERFNDKMVD